MGITTGAAIPINADAVVPHQEVTVRDQVPCGSLASTRGQAGAADRATILQALGVLTIDSERVVPSDCQRYN